MTQDRRSSIFGDEWRKCLEEHYKYVIKQDDKQTESTLTPILYDVGFREDELRNLYVQATMRSDELPDNFIPDVERATGDTPVAEQVVESVADTTFEVHPNECQCAACMDEVLEIGHDDEGQPTDVPPEPESAEGNIFSVFKLESEVADDNESDDPEKPKQMSMF